MSTKNIPQSLLDAVKKVLTESNQEHHISMSHSTGADKSKWVNFSVKDASGKQIGSLMLSSNDDGTNYSVREANVDASHRGRGHGKAMYLAAIRFADSNNANLMSDKSISVDADNTWQSLRKMGVDVSRHPNVNFVANKLRAHQNIDIGGKSIPIPSDEPVWKYNRKSTMTESTEHPMIEVDGVMKHRHNSLGQPIHHTEEGIKNFHRWFGDSKAVDEHGRPQVLYHGSNAHAYTGGNIERFNTNTERGAAFFSNHPEIAKQYGEKLYSTYVRLHNPLIVDGNNRYWSDLSTESKVSGDITPELHIADEKKTDDLNKISSEFGDLFGDDASPITRKFAGVESLNHKLSDITDKTTTDDVSKHAKKLGYDGVIFRNIKDSPVHDTKMYAPTVSDIYSVFKSSSVKSTHNSGNFHSDSMITESDEEDYRGSHTAPGPDYGAPAHDLTKGIYPEDFYSSRGARLYGDGRDDDYKVHSQLRTLHNRPEAEVNIYRAVPNDSKITDINAGDWVTTNLQYAHDHGERFDSHKILSKRVKAKEIFTDGNSFHEFGYHPAKD